VLSDVADILFANLRVNRVFVPTLNAAARLLGAELFRDARSEDMSNS
jgi:hypothetical protein